MQICTRLGYRNFLRVIVSTVLSMAYLSLHAQIESEGEFPMTGSPTDSVAKVKHSDPAWQKASVLNQSSDSFLVWDSAFVAVQRYNLLIRNAQPFVDLGTVASPHKLLLGPQISGHGFNTGLHHYQIYNKTLDSVKFYKASVPLSRFTYTQGGSGVFILDALHTQNFSPTWNIMVDFKSVQNGEIYTNSNQNHLHRATVVGSHMVSKNGLYSQTVLFSWNHARRNENRGLDDDTLFFRPGAGSIRTTGNYFPSSTTSGTFYAQRHHKLEQQLRWKKDQKIYLFHAFDWIKEKYEYNETSTFFSSKDTAFYGTNPLFNPGDFKDSSVWVQWNNSLGLGSKYNRFHWPVYWKAWYAYDRIAYNSIYKTEANVYNNQSIHLAAGLTDLIKGLSVQFQTHHYLAGWNQGNYKTHLDAQYLRSKDLSFSISALIQKYRPDFISERFSGNYLQYFINRKPSENMAFYAGLNWNHRILQLKLRAKTGSIKQHLYVSNLGIFDQLDRLNYTTIEGFLRIKMGKLYLENTITLQNNNQEIKIPYPKFTSLTGLYFQGKIFKNAMFARVGMDVWYMTEYFGYSYNPLNAQFYPTQTKAGNYPWVDFYVSGEVKTVMLYIKTEHVNESLMNLGYNNNYISAVGYPGDPFRLRFGFIWRFYN